MKLNFNKPIFDIKGQEIPNTNMGELLANMIAQGKGSNPIKIWELAKNIYAGKELELDTSDANLIKGLIETCENFPVMTKAQMLLEFKE